MRNVTFELQLTEADKGTLEFLSLTAGKIARLLFPEDRLNAERAESLFRLMTEQALFADHAKISNSQAVKGRLHAELGRAALELFGEVERRQLFSAVYPVVAGDNYAHKLLSEMCSSGQD